MNNEKSEANACPLTMALNHVSRLCRDVNKSINFYKNVLGLMIVERPHVLDFDGAWLFNYGVGIHLMQSKDEGKLPAAPKVLDPMDNHVSFQCDDMETMETRLKEYNVDYIKRALEEESGAKIDQLFFSDPDGFMIEICNCENFKLVPVGSIGNIMLPSEENENTKPKK